MCARVFRYVCVFNKPQTFHRFSLVTYTHTESQSWIPVIDRIFNIVLSYFVTFKWQK